MKKHLLILFFFFSLMSINAQNWQPFNSGEVMNYYSDSANMYYSIWVDSVDVVANDSVFYFNRVTKEVKPIQTYASIFAYYLQNQSQFFLSNAYCSASGSVVLGGDDGQKFYIKSKAKLNDTWVFDSANSVNAQVVQIGSSTIFGQQDSIKVILLNGMDSLILSKNHGIIQFPVEDSSIVFVKLVGLEKSGLGVSIPKYSDIYDYDIGDVFYYKYMLFTRYTTETTYKKIRITAKKIVNARYEYHANYNQVKIVQDTYDPTATMTYTMSDQDKIIVCPFYPDSATELYQGQSLVYNNSDLQYKFVNVKWNNKFQVIQKSYSSYPFAKFPDNDTIWKTSNPTISSFTMRGRIYGNKLGVLYQDYSVYNGSPYSNGDYREELVAYVRNGVLYGAIPEPFLPQKLPNIDGDNFSFYPNPIINNVTIEYLKSDNLSASLKVYNCVGSLVYEANLSKLFSNIDMSNWSSGTYFFHIQAENSLTVKKVVKL